MKLDVCLFSRRNDGDDGEGGDGGRLLSATARVNVSPQIYPASIASSCPNNFAASETVFAVTSGVEVRHRIDTCCEVLPCHSTKGKEPSLVASKRLCGMWRNLTDLDLLDAAVREQAECEEALGYVVVGSRVHGA